MPRIKVSDVLDTCEECGRKPQLWEETFYCKSSSKFKVECSKCGKKTGYFVRACSAVSAWNNKQYAKSRPRDFLKDNDGLIELMGGILGEVQKDYQRIASSRILTSGDLNDLQNLEEFIFDNPYMLPYDRDYVLEEMRRSVKKPRKKHVS